MAAHRDQKVGWISKVVAFNLLNVMPYGEQLYYLLQKNVTKTCPRKLSPTAKTASSQIENAQIILKQIGDVSNISLMEFGAGWDLYANMIYYCYGFNQQLAIDIRRWAKAEAINAVIMHLTQDPPPGAVRTPKKLVSDESLESDLQEYYGIKYRAPFDASKTDLEANSIDAIATTSVLEHIPAPMVSKILVETRRIVRDSAIMVHTIDFSDHYSHADPGINEFNYLRFGKKTWSFMNPSIHYQNRLRAPDYCRIFLECGFKVVEARTWSGSEETLSQIGVHSSFSSYSRDELLCLGGVFVLAPA